MVNTNYINDALYDNITDEELEALVEGRKMKRKEILEKNKIQVFNSGPNKGTYYVVIDGKKHQSKDKKKTGKLNNFVGYRGC